MWFPFFAASVKIANLIDSLSMPNYHRAFPLEKQRHDNRLKSSAHAETSLAPRLKNQLVDVPGSGADIDHVNGMLRLLTAVIDCFFDFMNHVTVHMTQRT